MRYIVTMILKMLSKFVTRLQLKTFIPLFAMAVMMGACAQSMQPRATGGELADDGAAARAPELDADLLFDLLAGEFAGNAGEKTQSTSYYLRAAERSSDPRVAARAAYIAIYAKDYDRALEMLGRWEKLDPADADIPRMYAMAYLQTGNAVEAAAYIQKILATVDGDSRQKALAVKHLLANESSVENGLAVLDALNKSEPGNQHMLILQARYAAQLEKYDEATALLDKVLEIDPTLSDVHIIKARILIAQGKPDAAQVLMASMLDKQPENEDLRLQYARLLIETRQFELAREQFLILYDKEPDNVEILLSLGLLYIEIDEPDKAQIYLQSMLDLGKNEDIANYYLGRIAQSKEQHKIAIAYYLKVHVGEYAFDAKLRIARLFTRLGRPEEGMAQLDKLAETEAAWPNRVRVYLTHGEILRGLHRYAEGLELYSRALKQKPDDPDLLYARALIAEKVDRIDITESDLLKVLSTEPKNANALNALGYTLADRTSRLEEALGYIKQAAELIPDDPAILDSLGWVSYRLGHMKDALKWLRMAFEKLGDPEIAAHYGEVLWKSDMKQEAQKVWDVGIKAEADHPVLVETLHRLNP
jgi:tetratricopeptide (TPR) repeat protein